MFNFGKAEPEVLPPGEEPQSTGSLWGEMFGLGPMFKMLTDPALGQHAHEMMQAIIESAKANARIEAKLDAYRQEVTALLAHHRANGTRGVAVASDVVDLGTRDNPGTVRQTVGPVAIGGPGEPGTATEAA